MSPDPKIQIPFRGPLVEARFVERPNRFLLRCELARSAGSAAPLVRERTPGPAAAEDVDCVVEVHMADPGRLKELLIVGRRVWIRHAASPTRRTDWSAVLVESPGGEGLVSLNTMLPNRLIHRALEARALEEFEGWDLERPEFAMGRSRIDFLLTREPSRRLALEVKSVTLVEDGVALFPDAVTARGARHVRELTAIAGTVDDSGTRWEAAILFVLQRNDAHRIEAARSIDPDFADALAEAKAAGVRVLGRRCHVSTEGLSLGQPVPAS